MVISSQSGQKVLDIFEHLLIWIINSNVLVSRKSNLGFDLSYVQFLFSAISRGYFDLTVSSKDSEKRDSVV